MENVKKYQKELFKELNLGHLPEAEKVKVLEMISDRFNKVIVYTLLAVLNDEQKKRFNEALKDEHFSEEAITEISAEVPGLAAKIEQALLEEYQAIKYAMSRSPNHSSQS